MSNVICQICLRTEITSKSVGMALNSFYDEICEYENKDNDRYRVCLFCRYMLIKFYNFKRRCLKACKILSSLKGMKNKPFPNNLHELIPTSLGFCKTMTPIQFHARTDELTNQPVIKHNIIDNADTYVPPPYIPHNDHDYINVKIEDGVQNKSVDITEDNSHDTKTDTVDTINKNIRNDGKVDIKNKLKPVINRDVVNNESKGKVSKVNDYLNDFCKGINHIDVEQNLKEHNIVVMEVDDPLENVMSLNNRTETSNDKFDKISSDDELNEISDVKIENTVSDDKLNETSVVQLENTFSNNELTDASSDDDLNDALSDNELDETSDDELNDVKTLCDDISEKAVSYDSDCDYESLLEMVKLNKYEPLNAGHIKNIELGEEHLKIGRKNNSLKYKVQYLKLKAELQGKILELFKNDCYDLGNDIVLKRDVFLKIYEKCDKPGSSLQELFLDKDTLDEAKVRVLLQALLFRFNPEYDEVFHTENLDTEEKKLKEFESRKSQPQYTNAPFKCDLCFKGFLYKNLLTIHLTKHAKSPAEKGCAICTIKSPTTRLCSSHFTAFTCKLCPLIVYDRTIMKCHFELHKGVKHQCKLCHIDFGSRAALQSHARAQHATRACAHCGRAFLNERGLACHLNLKHKDVVGAPQDAVTCGACSTHFFSEAALRRHRLSAHKNRVYRCQCDVYFDSLAELRAHRELHGHVRSVMPTSNSAPYQLGGEPQGRARVVPSVDHACPVCHELQPSRKFLYFHFRRAHPSERYQSLAKLLCDVCGKAFKAPGLLRQHHSAAHAHRAALRCRVCGRPFVRQNNLVRHINTVHSGALRFKCESCPAKFSKNCSLAIHLRTVHHKRRKPKAKKN